MRLCLISPGKDVQTMWRDPALVRASFGVDESPRNLAEIEFNHVISTWVPSKSQHFVSIHKITSIEVPRNGPCATEFLRFVMRFGPGA